MRAFPGLAFVIAAVMPAATAGQVAIPRSQPRVDQLLAVTPERVFTSTAKGAVIDINASRSWMAGSVGLASVVEAGGRIRMYFNGIEAGGDPYTPIVRVGLADSEDGQTFQMLNGGQPILSEGAAGRFDSRSVSHPFVMREMITSAAAGPGDPRRRGVPEYWMYYAGGDGTTGANGVSVQRLGRARSTDGIQWVRDAAPVMDVGLPGSVDSSQVASPCVLRTRLGFEMWYGAYDGAHRIAYATSADGISWTRHGAVSGLRGAAAGELGPSVYFDGGRYLMFYNSVDPVAFEWRLYAATSLDGRTWTPQYNGNPVVAPAPAGTFAQAGFGRNSAVHLSQLILRQGFLLGYYTGEDQTTQRIGLLRFRIQ